ncbi:hypothetical protein ANDROMEDA_59 [Bacillus phage Andromeda]|uniref:Uncharacterized protein n=3 Tax=Andromedavirus TaxID=1623275 RepID=M1IEN2_9CAUD|nr:hypothetical protein I905_gp59 [Bacillus phage Andromeda]YP_008770692.1 hypothetical protein Glittering_56 [Bacillus phage Glittering]AGE60898.1 hypothetical protein GEMINI_59 [Bacillus phage Gemini]AGE61129.1 hypothetical protein ANDROMEDA_59 [Bacillus phage Andromeda]AGY47243.1 hypothetical protein Glittering_56 [Bacillus phage Glittering]
MNRRQKILHEITLLEEKHELTCTLPERDCLESCAISKQIKELGEQLKRKYEPRNLDRVFSIIEKCRTEKEPYKNNGEDMIFLRYCGFNLEEFVVPLFKCSVATARREQEKAYNKKVLTDRLSAWYDTSKQSEGAEFSI